jgi:serine/threonine protein kinase
MRNLIGKTLGRYHIVDWLGHGGMAAVYKAHHPGLDQYVAIKVLHGHLVEEKDLIMRFKREAAAVARLRHPNIVRVLDFDVQDEIYYMVMEFIEGPTLRAELEARATRGQLFPLDETLRILGVLVDAINYAHSQGTVHRDLKPANVIFTGGGQVVLTDFGIARMIDAPRHTLTGAIVGTPAYLSPEQGQGKQGDERSDIYSLGVILYEMVTGQVPFEADTPVGIIMKHINETLASPTTISPYVPEVVERIILRAMSKNPDDRYQTAGEMAQALSDGSGLIIAQMPSTSAPSVLAPRAVDTSLTPALIRSTDPQCPVQCGRPIKDPANFFGRERELRRLRGYLRGLHSVSIVGSRRIGKTSLLLQLCHPNTTTQLEPDPSRYALVYVDCQGLKELDAEGWRSLLVSRVAEGLGIVPTPRVRDGFHFQDIFRQLLGGGRRVVLMLDEFEDLASNPHLNADFFSGLRALGSGHSLAFVTASRLPLIELTYHDSNVLSSPFFNIFVTLKVRLLDEKAARALLGHPQAGFSPETVDFLLELTGPHPCFLQLAGYHAFEWQEAGILDETARERVREEMEEAVEPHLRHGWEHLSQPARSALVTLPLTQAGEAGLNELREACLVHGGTYLSPLVERFARRQTVPDVLQVRELWADLRRRQVVWRNRPLSLSDLSYRLLCHFLERPGRPIPWQALELDVWGQHEQLPEDYAGNPERVDAAVDRLRRALREIGAGSPIRFQGGAYTFEPGRMESHS